MHGPTTTFRAPWSTSLKLLTLFSVAILVGIPAIGLMNPEGGAIWLVSMVAVPLIVLAAAPFFMIRGYELAPGRLRVRRLGWTIELDLEKLQSAQADPEAMKGSIRTFGNGGMFCYAGRFRNRKLGKYRALATDPKSAVVLRLPEDTVVVTPADPGRFVAQVESLRY